MSDTDTLASHCTVIGLGNELLTDDGAGIRTVRALKERLPSRTFRFQELSVGGLQLLDSITGTAHCIIVDAVATGRHPPGTIYRFVQTADSAPVTLTSSHQIDLGQVLTLAALMGAEVPHTVTVYGIEAADTTTFHEGCTEEVSAAIPKLVEAICRDVNEQLDTTSAYAGQWHIINEPLPV